MTKLTPHEGLSNGKLKKIAVRLRSRMDELNLSAAELGRRCDSLAQATYADGECPNLTRERISKILMNAQPHVGTGAARVVSQAEIMVLSNVLEVSPEWLANQTETALPAFWDIGTDPKYAGQVAHLLTHYEEKTGESLIWGENLLCSFTPPEFAHAYHENYFAEYAAVGLREQKRILVKVYDGVGNARRQKLFGNPASRNYLVTQIIFQSELEKIVTGAGNYAGMPAALRIQCLKNLAELLADDSSKIRLIVACDADVPHLKHLLRDYDRFSASGDEFAMWAYHSGRLAWSEDKKVVRRHRRILEELIKRAVYREPGEVSEYLLRLSEQMEKKEC